MKIFFSESNNEYKSYTFNYAIYCVAASIDELPEIYNRGFLPYSSDTTIQKEIFYLARSLRVNLADFADSSENRRVNRKVAPLNISVDFIPKSAIQLDDQLLNFCLSYAKERFSNNAMNEARLKYILSREVGTHWLRFQLDGKPIGYVLSGLHGKIFHYWYAFFDSSLLREYPLGKWIMWRTIHWAKEQNLDYVYLGTCYGKSALYKARDFKGLAFFDGRQWNVNIKLLKEWCKTDSEPLVKDRFKLLSEPNVALDVVMGDEIDNILKKEIKQ